MLYTLLVLALLPAPGDWPAYGRDDGGSRSSPLTAITRANVAQLRPAWTYHTGDQRDEISTSVACECTPIFVGGVLYGVTPYNKVFALNPDTGRPLWTYDPKIVRSKPTAVESFACRGVAAWRDSATGKRRIFLATYDARLIALDARSGAPAPSFGVEGAVNLRIGVGVKHLDHYFESSPPCVVGDLVVVGSGIGDNWAVDMPSGVVRAYDARTGALRWSWEPLRPGGDTFHSGAGNAWAPLSADPARDLVFVPTGSPSPDYSGQLRLGDDLDANSIVALQASTGRKVWAFQVVHHDLWDYDVPAQPIVATVAGRRAVIAMTKMGHVFLLDELTGKPLLPVEERPVPQSDVPGETTAPTQPFPVLPPPLSPTKVEPWGPTQNDKADAESRMSLLRSEGIFTPPSLRGSIGYPGGIGGSNWSGGCFLAAKNLLFVNTNSLATAVTLIPGQKFSSGTRLGGEFARQEGAPYGMKREWLFTTNRLPQTKPPFGQLHAVDLGSGKIQWSKPLGWMPSLAAYPESHAWGSPNLGGACVTATGLVFIAASEDCHLRAFDASTGHVLWESELPAGGQATPMVFRSPRTGREYVVQCAGGHSGLRTPSGDSVIAFSLR